MAEIATRVQSPSSINTYKQCPRKYYYIYIKKLPTKPSIHLVRGTIVHETLEYFFERTVPHTTGDLLMDLQLHILTILKERWTEHSAEVETLPLTASDITSYREETTIMILNWLNHFFAKLQKEMRAGWQFPEAFARLTPRREEEYRHEELQVRGFIDAIHEIDGEVHIRDYKTSKHPVITEEYQLQLALYALMYERKHGIKPTSLGIFFLKHGETLMELNDELLRRTTLDVRWVHERTQTDDLTEYPKRASPLCNYCDFYEQCWKQKEISDF